jgi:transposase
MIDDMSLRNLSPATQRSYIHAVKRFDRFHNRPPDQPGLADVRAFQVHLVSQGISWPALNQTVCALRFFYGVTLDRAEIPERIAYARTLRKLPGKASDPGCAAGDNRLFINGVLWVLRSGARWSDLPERYGKYKTVHKRFTRWARAGVWEGIFALFARDRDNEYLMIDSSIVRAHAQAATGQKGGSATRLWGAPEEA